MIMPLMLAAVRSSPAEIRGPVLTAAFRAPGAGVGWPGGISLVINDLSSCC